MPWCLPYSQDPETISFCRLIAERNIPSVFTSEPPPRYQTSRQMSRAIIAVKGLIGRAGSADLPDCQLRITRPSVLDARPLYIFALKRAGSYSVVLVAGDRLVLVFALIVGIVIISRIRWHGFRFARQLPGNWRRRVWIEFLWLNDLRFASVHVNSSISGMGDNNVWITSGSPAFFT